MKKKVKKPAKRAANKKTVAKKVAKVAKKPAKRMAKKSNVISFTELFELKKKKEAQNQENFKGQEMGNVHDIQQDQNGRKPKVQMNVRNGRTNGAGVRHH